MTVLVLASINWDTTSQVERLPRPGDTVLARDTSTGTGGKGANQAIALARHGVAVSVIGTVGADINGSRARRALTDERIDISAVQTHPELSTGTASITVDTHGENTIVVTSGANSAVVPDQVRNVPPTANPGTLFLTQGELNRSVIEAFAATCAAAGGRFVLNLAPVIDLDPATLADADPLVVNENEARQLAGVAAEASIDAAREVLLRRVRSVVITCGANGARYASPDAHGDVPPPACIVVRDTTGAGDAFIGALCAALEVGAGLGSAVHHAVRFAGDSVQRDGASKSYAQRGSTVATFGG